MDRVRKIEVGRPSSCFRPHPAQDGLRRARPAHLWWAKIARWCVPADACRFVCGRWPLLAARACRSLLESRTPSLSPVFAGGAHALGRSAAPPPCFFAATRRAVARCVTLALFRRSRPPLLRWHCRGRRRGVELDVAAASSSVHPPCRVLVAGGGPVAACAIPGHGCSSPSTPSVPDPRPLHPSLFPPFRAGAAAVIAAVLPRPPRRRPLVAGLALGAARGWR